MDVLVVILIVILIISFPIAFYNFLEWNNKRQDKEEKYYHEIGVYSGFSIYDDLDTIKKYYKKYPKEKEIAERLNKEFHEKQRRELIIKRVFAYDYEEMLYRIYSPFTGSSLGTLQQEYIIQRISDLKNISEDKASDLFELLVKKEIIIKLLGHGFCLTPMLTPSFPRDIDWKVVTELDLNLDKWIRTHEKEYKEELEFVEKLQDKK